MIGAPIPKSLLCVQNMAKIAARLIFYVFSLASMTLLIHIFHIMHFLQKYECFRQQLGTLISMPNALILLPHDQFFQRF